MATSGSNTTWSSNGGHYVKVTWNETSQSTTENRSAVTVRLYVGSKSGWSISDSSNSYSLVINGTTYSGSNASISQSGSEDLIMTQNVTINHNSDGTKSFSMRGSVSGLYFGGITGSTFSGTLDTIPRASTLSGTASMTAGWSKTVGISRASSSFNHTLHIYLTKSGVADDLIRSEDFSTSQTSKTLEWTASQINDMFNEGHGYWTGTKMVLITYSGTTEIGRNTYTGSLDWPSNNSVATMENSIDVGESFNVSISKASSLYAHEAKLTLTNGTALGTGSAQGITTGTSFSLKPVESIIESNTMTSQSISVQLWIRTVLASTTSTEVRGWTLEKTSTVYIPESPPTMGSMSYTELNASVATAINSSGVNPPLVQGYSHPKFTFTAASPKRSASISNYSVSIGGETLSRTSAGSLEFTPANLGGRTIKVGSNTNAVLTVTDSRGFTNSISIPVTYMAYSPPALTINLRRLNGFGDSVELTGSATISSLGGINTVVAANGFKHKFRELPSGTFQATPLDLPSTIINGIPTITKKTTTLLNTKSFEFEVTVTDKITTTTVKKTIGTGKPIAFMDSKLLSVGINRFPTGSGRFEVQDEIGMFPGVLGAKVGAIFTGNTNKSIIRFDKGGGTDPGMIMHETSELTADLNKGVLHLMPSDDSDNVSDYVTVRSTNFTQAEQVRIYPGGNAWFNGVVTVGALVAGSSGISSSGTLSVNTLGMSIQMTGRDISINGKRALVGFETSSHNRLDINYTNDYANGIKMYGATEITDLVTISTNSEGLRLKGTDHEYISFYNGSSRQGYIGQGSAASTEITLTAEVGNALIRSMTGDIVLSGNTVKASGGLEGRLRHTNGYMEVASFSSGYGTGQAELWYDANGRRLQISSRNSGDTGARDINVHAYNFVGRLNGTSSIKFKRNVEDYTENALEKINASRVRTYNYTYDKDEDRHVGIIIEENAPKEIVSLEGETVDIYGMVSMSWRAIQQLSEENKSLKKEKTAMKTRMTKLEKKNKELEERLSRLEKLLGGGLTPEGVKVRFEEKKGEGIDVVREDG